MGDQDIMMQMREVFGFFEKANNQMPLTDLGTAMRALNLNPSNKQLEEYSGELNNGSGMLDFGKFQEYMLVQLEQEKDSREMLVNALRVFDKEGDGYIQTAELKSVMTTMGEKYTAQEFDELVKNVDRGGKIKYDDFADRMLMTYQQLGDELVAQG
eukprot:NODE_1875_length_707_cov_155.775862_g1825_i0.p1 GENE.NODE_1875_length_707_cov_155.775862_g1825_i0~~NODE_1875_length_707_cov_155.775862_g1825_i0.p1  ORF type:complete len:156 (+),score=37.38 NODE_1875_length_707_cov_155.775862_g1825_i0:178-645(+)